MVTSSNFSGFFKTETLPENIAFKNIITLLGNLRLKSKWIYMIYRVVVFYPTLVCWMMVFNNVGILYVRRFIVVLIFLSLETEDWRYLGDYWVISNQMIFCRAVVNAPATLSNEYGLFSIMYQFYQIQVYHQALGVSTHVKLPWRLSDWVIIIIALKIICQQPKESFIK